jgi:hypothetical protein
MRNSVPNNILFNSTLSKNPSYLSQTFKLDGKSYKITNKGVVVNMRFNRSNKTLLVLNNIMFRNKNGQKKIYCLNGTLLTTKLKTVLYKIRKVNTYTLRGLWLNNHTVQKRVGRVSGY